MKETKYKSDFFDDFEPSEGHRTRFQNKLDQEIHRKRNPFTWAKIAAAIIVLIGIGTVVFQNFSTEENIVAVDESSSTENIPLASAEHYYKNSFDQQFSAIAKNYTDPESLAMIVQSEKLIQELRKEYKELEKELKNTGDQRVATAMILNYKSRIDILEQLMKKLEYVNEIKKQTNEKSNV